MISVPAAGLQESAPAGPVIPPERQINKSNDAFGPSRYRARIKFLQPSLSRMTHLALKCKADPERKGPSWYGLWIMRTVGSDGQEKILVTARTRVTQNAIRVREFKTATGVISFLVGVGFSQASIPMKNGETTSHRLVSD